PACSGPAAAASAVYDDRYGYPGRFDRLACDACGHRFIDWRPSDATLTRLYSDYYPRGKRSVDDFRPLQSRRKISAWWHGQRATAAFSVPRGVRVLDIGCGFGESLGYHRLRGCDVQGVEADENIARVAERFGFAVHVGLFDATRYRPE